MALFGCFAFCRANLEFHTDNLESWAFFKKMFGIGPRFTSRPLQGPLSGFFCDHLPPFFVLMGITGSKAMSQLSGRDTFSRWPEQLLFVEVNFFAGLAVGRTRSQPPITNLWPAVTGRCRILLPRAVFFTRGPPYQKNETRHGSTAPLAVFQQGPRSGWLSSRAGQCPDPPKL